MDKLQEARTRINEIDKEMADLFQERMQTVEDVILYKKEHGMQVLDTSREEEVIRRNLEHLKEKKYQESYSTFIKYVMKISRSYQKSVLYHNVVGYAGTKGAFSNIATTHLFKEATHVAFPTFPDVFKAVLKDEIQYGVIPFENSYTGEVGEILDLLMEYDVHIIQMYDLKIDQNLLGMKGATLQDIKQVYSKDQAISQCQKFLKGRGFEIIPYANTALAAEFVAKQKDISKAAIASKETADLFHLEIIEENIQTSFDNTTRFIVISKEIKKEGNRFNLLFTLPHNAGTLANVMQIIAKGNFNMESIKSRSMKQQPWNYYFYVEIVGNPYHAKEQTLLKELRSVCERVKVLGCYEKESRDGK